MIYCCHKSTAHSLLFTLLLIIVFPTQLIYLINPSLTLSFTLLWFDFGQLTDRRVCFTGNPLTLFMRLHCTMLRQLPDLQRRPTHTP